MSPEEKATLITDLHAHYCARTGFELILNDPRRRMWWDWCCYAAWTWTKDDLGRVIGYLLSQIKVDKRNEGALKITNLIGQPDKFEEDLGLAKKAAKPNAMFVAKPQAPKASREGKTLLNSFGQEIHSGQEAAADFAKLFQR